MMGNGLYQSIFDGVKGNISIVMPEKCSGVTRINDEVFISTSNKKILFMFWTFNP